MADMKRSIYTMCSRESANDLDVEDSGSRCAHDTRHLSARFGSKEVRFRSPGKRLRETEGRGGGARSLRSRLWRCGEVNVGGKGPENRLLSRRTNRL